MVTWDELRREGGGTKQIPIHIAHSEEVRKAFAAAWRIDICGTCGREVTEQSKILYATSNCGTCGRRTTACECPDRCPGCHMVKTGPGPVSLCPVCGKEPDHVPNGIRCTHLDEKRASLF